MTIKEKIETGQVLEIDGRRNIILNSWDSFYIVIKGKAYLHFSEIDDYGNNKRKHFINEFYVDDIITGSVKNNEENKYGFVISGEDGTEVLKVHYRDIEKLENDTLKESIFKKLDCFYTNVFKLIDRSLDFQIEDFDIEKKNLQMLEIAKEYVDWKLKNEYEESKLRKKNNEELNKKSISSILNIIIGKKKDFEIYDEISGESELYDACKVICKKMSINIASYEDIKKTVNEEIGISDIGRVSKFPVRNVILEENWWKSDSGPILAYAIEDERPLACIPISPSKYMVYDVRNKKIFPFTKDLAKDIIPRGQMFYRPFPNKVLTKKDILTFGFREAWKRDIVRVLFFTLMGTLVGLILPMLNEKIFDDYIPEGESGQLIQVGIVIIAFMVGNFFVSLTKMFATFRATNRMEYSLQTAVFDRLFNFPNKIYSKYTSGDLSMRAMGITMIFNTLADVIVSVFLATIFSFLYLWRMFKYSKELSYVGFIMVIITVLMTLGIGFLQLKYEKKLIEISNRMAGTMYQLLLGIAKIRISGSEDRAITKWNSDYFKSRDVIVRKERMSNFVMAFNNLLNVMFSVAIYYMLIKKDIKITFGAFAGFMSAFGSFSGSMVQMAQTFIKINSLIPVYDKAKPVLETLAEYEENLIIPGNISGEIEISNVNFKYDEEGPYVLKDLSFKINKGEYVGLVGSSGSGKSTLLKLLLGFEKPQIGKIFYDNKDLESLDKRELRKKLGVVLQDGQIIAGSIYENITITNDKLSSKRARDVVKEVGLENDIEKMPMGLYTVLMEDGGTISGGQKQRILIARAIANQPKLLFFDEATSALDNITQNIVCESLERLKVTRVVIAHRLSTIVNCDRIIVMDNGQIKEQGSYNELMAKKGMFFELARRQLA